MFMFKRQIIPIYALIPLIVFAAQSFAQPHSILHNLARLGKGRWSSIREPYHFLAPLLLVKVITAPGWGAAQDVVYFRMALSAR